MNEKVANATHCNWRESDTPTSWQSFWALITRPLMHQPIQI